MKRFAFSLLLILFLAACAPSLTNSDSSSGGALTTPAPVSNIPVTPTDDPAFLPTLFPNISNNGELSRVNEQGAVVFEVTPLNLGTPAETLDFDVAMNTHSVDLSMDLATLATLTTDTGVRIQATKWEAIPGGHHVSGKLIFPTMVGGKSFIGGASKLTLTVINVDAASRVFEWELN